MTFNTAEFEMAQTSAALFCIVIISHCKNRCCCRVLVKFDPAILYSDRLTPGVNFTLQNRRLTIHVVFPIHSIAESNCPCCFISHIWNSLRFWGFIEISSLTLNGVPSGQSLGLTKCVAPIFLAEISFFVLNQVSYVTYQLLPCWR